MHTTHSVCFRLLFICSISMWKWVICRNVHILIVYSSENWTYKCPEAIFGTSYDLLFRSKYTHKMCLKCALVNIAHVQLLKKSIYSHLHICPWHLKVTFLSISLSLSQSRFSVSLGCRYQNGKIVFMIRFEAVQTNYIHFVVTIVVNPPQNSNNNNTNTNWTSQPFAMCQRAYQVYTWFIPVFVVKTVPFSRMCHNFTNPTA